eukprot:gene2456-3222_t
MLGTNLLGAAWAGEGGPPAPPPPPPSAVTEVHVVFSNHFDAGCKIRGGDYITMHGPADPYSYQVLNRWFDEFIPAALGLAETTGLHSTWMTQPWILALYLDCPQSGVASWDGRATPLLHCPNATMLSRVRSALAQGNITFHAFPHNGVCLASLSTLASPASAPVFVSHQLPPDWPTTLPLPGPFPTNRTGEAAYYPDSSLYEAALYVAKDIAQQALLESFTLPDLTPPPAML